MASPDGAQGSVSLNADARLYAGLFDAGQNATFHVAAVCKGYVHLVRGAIKVNGVALHTGDAALLSDEPRVTLSHAQDAEVLVFDLGA